MALGAWWVVGNKEKELDVQVLCGAGEPSYSPPPVGQDATKAFADVGHSESARELKEKYYIGDLSGVSCGGQCSPVCCIGLPLER